MRCDWRTERQALLAAPRMPGLDLHPPHSLALLISNSACFSGPPFCYCRCGGMQAPPAPASQTHNYYETHQLTWERHMPTSRTITSVEIEMGYCDWPGLGHVLAERCRKQGTAGIGLSESHDPKGPCYSSKEVQGRDFGHDVLFDGVSPTSIYRYCQRMSATLVDNKKYERK